MYVRNADLIKHFKLKLMFSGHVLYMIDQRNLKN